MEPQSAYIDAQGISLHYVDWGKNGPPLVLLHGGRRTCRSWDVVARQLSHKFWVIALDAKGHGDSEKPTSGYGYQQRLLDFQGFLDAMELETCYGMGHSAGAITMALHGERYPGRLKRLFLIEPLISPRRATIPSGGLSRVMRQRRVWSSREELAAYLRQHPDTKKWREDVLRDVVCHEVSVHEDGSVEMKWSTDVYNSGDQLKDDYNLINSASHISVPTFLMYGTDSFVPKDSGEQFAKALPKGTFELVAGAGHNVYMEYPDLVFQRADEFFASQDK